METGKNVLTLDEFRATEIRNFAEATVEISNLLRDIGLAAKNHQCGSEQGRAGRHTG